jgi:glutamine amidotransferase
MIAIIDYGMGNLRSVQKALEGVGGDARIVTDAPALARADKIVLPGVAAFGDAMVQLRQQGLVDPIRRAVGDGVPYLGFCLGLQLLFEVSFEHGEHEGLGLVGGQVRRFDLADVADGRRLAVPHMGWNQLNIRKPCGMLEGIGDGEYAYFAHSYCVVPTDDDVIATTTEYGVEFTSSICRDHVFATQFHPEKSQAVGLRLLENFVGL